VSTCLRALAEILAGYTDSGVLRVLVTLGGLGQAGGVLLFVVNMWTRVRMPPPATPPRA
jgi:hypothetical protein